MMEKRQIPPLDNRLSAAASFARPGQIPLDVGTDHGYIPISLLLSGSCDRALASDVNPGPLAKAEENGVKYGVSHRMKLYLADGIGEIPLDEEQVGDVFICGMGGELIARIVSACPGLKENRRRLILQPMTMADELRRSLASSGYCIRDEALTGDGRRIYQIVVAEYDGIVRLLSRAEALLGPVNLSCGSENAFFAPLLLREIRACRVRLEGRRAGGLATDEDEALLWELEKIALKEGIAI